MSEQLFAVAGSEYEWLQDFLMRMQSGESAITGADYDQISGLLERRACCDRCESIWNEAVLEAAGYQKIGVGDHE